MNLRYSIKHFLYVTHDMSDNFSQTWPQNDTETCMQVFMVTQNGASASRTGVNGKLFLTVNFSNDPKTSVASNCTMYTAGLASFGIFTSALKTPWESTSSDLTIGPALELNGGEMVRVGPIRLGAAIKTPLYSIVTKPTAPHNSDHSMFHKFSITLLASLVPG